MGLQVGQRGVCVCVCVCGARACVCMCVCVPRCARQGVCQGIHSIHVCVCVCVCGARACVCMCVCVPRCARARVHVCVCQGIHSIHVCVCVCARAHAKVSIPIMLQLRGSTTLSSKPMSSSVKCVCQLPIAPPWGFLSSPQFTPVAVLEFPCPKQASFQVCVGGGGMPYYRGRPAWVQGWALSGGGPVPEVCLMDVIMTALAPLESRHPRLGQSLWWLWVMRPWCLHAHAAPAGVLVLCVCVCVCVCGLYFLRGRSLCSHEMAGVFGSVCCCLFAPVIHPFCGIRTSVCVRLGNLGAGPSVCPQKELAADCFRIRRLYQPLCVCVCVCDAPEN